MNILVLNGNNESVSLSAAICEAYIEGARTKGHDVILMNISEMDFDPVLHEGYHSIQELEPCLKEFQEKLLWAKHFVVVYPTWWGSLPAKLVGLFDRSFYAGFAYKYHDKDPLWDKLLAGRSAQIITTMDAPYLWYFFVYRSAGTNMLRNAILKFCGIKPVSTYHIARVRYKTRGQLQKEINKIKELALNLPQKL